MENIIDYLKANKDITFNEKEFSPLDALIFARLTYVDYKLILKSNKYRTKKKLTDVISSIFLEKENGNFRFRLKEDKELLEIIRASLRYRNIYIKSFVFDTDINKVKQFSAVTFVNEEKDNRFMYISFKGTDGTVTGWKEDFNMAYLEVVPAQAEAAKYLKKIVRFSSIKKIYVGGHSKGGNLAIYAASQLRRSVQNNIKQIYSFDGPGFKQEFLDTNGFNSIKDKITLYTPQSSIIGRLLNKDYRTIIVQSRKKMLYQHNVYNWKIENNNFVVLEKYTFLSNKIDITLKNNLQKMTIEERKTFVDEIFDIVKDLSKDDVIDFGDGMIDFLKRFRLTFKSKSKATQELILSLLSKSKDDEKVKFIEPNKNTSKLSSKIKSIQGKLLNKSKNKKLEVIDTTIIEDNEQNKISLLSLEDRSDIN